MASVSTLSFLKSRLYAKSRLFNVKFHFCHKISFLKLRLYVKSRFVKSRLYCITLVPWMSSCWTFLLLHFDIRIESGLKVLVGIVGIVLK